MSLLDLPAELVQRIYSFLDPSSHLDFALCCRTVAALARDVLARHQTCHKLHLTYADRPFQDARKNLLKIAQDHIRAWHVRTFEIWNDIEEAEETWSAANPADALHRPRTPEESLGPTVYSRSELSLIADSLRNAVPDLPLNISVCCFRIQAGDSQMLRLATLLLCPRVKTIKFSRFPVDNLGETEFSADKLWTDQTALDGLTACRGNLFSDLVRGLSSMPDAVWPPSFQSIRQVAVGFGLDPGFDRPDCKISPLVVAPLFLLPNIETIYIRGLYWDNESPGIPNPREPISHFALGKKSSNIQNIYFEDAWENDVSDVVRMLTNSARSLKLVVFKKCNFNNFDSIVGDLPSCLDTLIVIDDTELRGYRCSSFRPEELNGSKALKTVTLDMSDVRLDSLYVYNNNSDAASDGLSGNVAGYHDFVHFVSETAIPESVEVVIFTWSDRGLKYKDVAAVDDALVELIQSNHCTNLTEIHLELMEGAIKGAIRLGDGVPYQAPSGGWFRRTVDRGKEYGVDVFTEQDRGSTARCIEEICRPLFGFCLPASTARQSE